MRNPRHNLDDDYRELELPPGATLAEVRNSYRELALLWHPDRRNDGQGRMSRAHQKMTRINLAYERLRKALERKTDSKTIDVEPPGRGRAHSRRSRNEQTSHTERPRPRQEMRTNSLGMSFLSVEGTPALFSIWQTRVHDYRAYADAAGGVDGSWKNPGFAQTAAHPVVNVSWEDAARFCLWLTNKERREGKLPMNAHYRLPTDAEWSWAVGIGSREWNGTPRQKANRLKMEYPWGTAWPPPKQAGNFDPSLGTDSFDFTSPVGSFAANAQGLFDLAGNVWEWCEDFLDGPAGHGASAPAGVRVLRGGSWNFSGAINLLSSYRNGAAQDARSVGIGFRIVLVLG